MLSAIIKVKHSQLIIEAHLVGSMHALYFAVMSWGGYAYALVFDAHVYEGLLE